MSALKLTSTRVRSGPHYRRVDGSTVSHVHERATRVINLGPLALPVLTKRRVFVIDDRGVHAHSIGGSFSTLPVLLLTAAILIVIYLMVRRK
jgi:hypothetical protein